MKENYKEYAKALNATSLVLEWIDHTLTNYLKKENKDVSQDEIEHIIDYLVSPDAPNRNLTAMSYIYAKKNAEKWMKQQIKTGNCSAASNTGDYSSVDVGAGAVGMVVGYKTKGKGTIGSWLVLSEAIRKDNITYIQDVKAEKVDGEKIKSDTWYTLEKGTFVEVIENDK